MVGCCFTVVLWCLLQKYLGLVKGAREIDHYQLQPGPGPGIHRSSFSGQDCLLLVSHLFGECGTVKNAQGQV